MEESGENWPSHDSDLVKSNCNHLLYNTYATHDFVLVIVILNMCITLFSLLFSFIHRKYMTKSFLKMENLNLCVMMMSIKLEIPQMIQREAMRRRYQRD